MLQKQDLFLNTLLENITVEVIDCDSGQVMKEWGAEEMERNYTKFYYIQQGRGFIEFDNNRYEPSPGELVIIPEGRAHSFGTDHDAPFQKYYCHFTARIGCTSLFDVIKNYMSVLCDDCTKKEVKWLFEEMLAHRSGNSCTDALYMKSALLRLIALFLDHSFVEDNGDYISHFSGMIEVVHYFEAHMDEEITLDGLSIAYGLHPSYFSMIFKKIFGQPPIKYLNNIRMDRAKKLLLTTDSPISEIAEKIGFINAHYFSASFKKHFELSPTAYRKTQRSITTG